MNNEFMATNFIARIKDYGRIKTLILADYRKAVDSSTNIAEGEYDYALLLSASTKYLSEDVVLTLMSEVTEAAQYHAQLVESQLDVSPLLLAQREDALHETFERQERYLNWNDHFDNDRECGSGS